MLDGDEAGRGAMEEIADRHRRAVFQVDVVTLSDGVQDCLSSDELCQLLNSVTVMR
jgi:hypothetical protein